MEQRLKNILDRNGYTYSQFHINELLLRVNDLMTDDDIFNVIVSYCCELIFRG